MKEKDEDIVHAGMYQNPKKHLILAEFSNSPWTGGEADCLQVDLTVDSVMLSPAVADLNHCLPRP